MGKDRLAEFRQKGKISPQREGRGDNVAGTSQGSTDKGAHTSLQIDVIESLKRLHKIDKFFEKVDDLRKLTQDLKNDVRNVKNHHIAILSSPIPDEKKKKELDALMATIKTKSKAIRGKLKSLEKDVKHEEADVGIGETPASLRIRKTQYSCLLIEFIEVIEDYEKDQVNYRDRCKARIKRQLHITDANLTDNQIDHMIEDGNFSIFTHGILIGQAKQKLADVTARHNDIQKLEKSLKELHGLFLDVEMLIYHQGDVVDRIETQVALAKEYTGKARDHLRIAEKLQLTLKKNKLWIMIIVILLVVAIGLAIYFSL